LHHGIPKNVDAQLSEVNAVGLRSRVIFFRIKFLSNIQTVSVPQFFLLAAESSRLDLGLPTDWSRVESWCRPTPGGPIMVHTSTARAPQDTENVTRKVSADWATFPFKEIPKVPETRVDIDALEKLVLTCESKLLKQEFERAKRAIDYLRNGAPAHQRDRLKSCLVQNKLASADARVAVLKTMKEWVSKGFVAGPFKEPPLDDFRVNGMIAIIKGEC
jgi:hypothetical protein